MKRVVLIVAVMALFLATAAMADTMVTYSTTGGFNGTSSTVLHVGGVTITYHPQAVSTISLVSSGAPYYDWGTAQFGYFTVSGSGTGTANGSQTFQLTLTQTQPAPGGTATDSATLNGKITATGSQLSLTFAPPPFVFAPNGATYSPLTPSPVSGVDWAVIYRTTIQPAGQITSLQGLGQFTPTPEPSSLLLLGAGISGLVGMIRRKRA